jgi:hypothetical protein
MTGGAKATMQFSAAQCQAFAMDALEDYQPIANSTEGP